METWILVQRAIEIADVLSCAAVAAVLFYALSGRRRSTATTVLALFGAFVLGAGLSNLSESTLVRWPADWLKFTVWVALTIVTVVLSISLIRRIPRAVAFQDRKYLREASRELRQSKDRFQRAIDGSCSGLWEWNIDLNTVWYSPRFRELLGYATEEEFPDELESWKSALDPADTERVFHALNSHLEDQGAFDVEYRLRLKSGEYRWFNARGLAIRDQDGRPYLMSGSIQDVHDRKRAEEAIRRRDEYLNQKQKMESLGELAGGTAHEFNNLLQAISGQIQFAERVLPKQSAAKKELAMAANLIEQSTHFTRQLLDFSRRHPRDVEPVNPNELVTQLAALLHSMLGGQVELRVRLGNDVGRVLADATALQQVLLNLCINARDAMPDGGRLVVRTCPAQIRQNEIVGYPDARPGLYAIISISDTGCGMTEETKSKIFEPFFTTKAIGKGTGLGLAVAYSVVKECGGIIDVESSVGHGSTFTIWLPVTEQPARPATANALPSTEKEQRRGATILYAEDTKSVRRAVTHVLKQNGYRVLAASDGQNAVRLFEEHMTEIDLALLDVYLPRMGGDEVLHELRNRRPELPVVFCSGSVSHLINQDILDSEHIWLIDKPFQADALLKLLDDALAAQSDYRLTLA